MSNPRDAEDVLTGIVEEHYDLGRMRPIEVFEGAHQRRHRKYIVDSAKGQFLLKTYGREPEVLDNLRFQHRLGDHLIAKGLPVPKIVHAKDDRRVVEVDNYAIELQQFIRGDMMQVTGKSLATAARALGKFHAVCRGFPCPTREATKWRFSEVPRDMLGALYERSLKTGDPDAMENHCNHIALFLREASNELRYEVRDQLETGLIHGDWHGGNLLFREDTLVAILDLEFAGDGCYLEDLAYAVSNLCIRTAVDTTIMQNRTDWLTHQYQKYRRLAPAEEFALYYAIGVKHVATVCYQSIQLDGTVAGRTADQWMKILDTQTQWLGHQAMALRRGQ